MNMGKEANIRSEKLKNGRPKANIHINLGTDRLTDGRPKVNIQTDPFKNR